MRLRSFLFVVAAVLVLVPDWTGEERLALLGAHPSLMATRVVLDRRDPARRRVGRLTFLGGLHLTSRDPAFGGYSSLAVAGNRFTLLSDGGNVIAFTLKRDWRPHGLAFANLPAGPGTGWDKRDRDSESMAIDPATGQIWVGFEGYNAIWRYARGFTAAEGHVEPPAMRRWPVNGGPESLARLPDGRILVISEQGHVRAQRWHGSEGARWQSRDALVFGGDPVAQSAPAFRFALMVDGRYDPSDATALPNGDVLVLLRAFHLPFRFSNRIMLVRKGDIRPGAVVRGTEIATLDAPMIHDNFEGIAATREGHATILWLVSDDNQSLLQRTLLLKFRLD